MIEEELKRLMALESYEIFHSEPDEDYDCITNLASYICKTPVALINFLDDKVQWTKSKIGMDLDEIPKEISFCQHTIKNDFLFEVNDSLKDIRFKDNPLVTKTGGIRYYAGVPLVAPGGERIGALCVIDFQPNQLDEQQKTALKVLAKEVISHLEVRKKNRLLERMLKEAQAFENLFNNSNEIHCITDAEGKIEYTNDSVEQLLGYSPSEVLGKTIWDFCLPEERDRVMPRVYEQIAAGKTRFLIETTVLTKYGEVRWFEWSDVLKDGKWLANGRDITERKEHELKLNTLSLAVEKSSAGVIIRNAQSEIEWFNAAAESVIGYGLSELQGKTFGDLLVGPQTDVSILGLAKEHNAAMKPYEVEIILYKKDATPVWVFISNNPVFGSDGKLERQIGIIIDITERKHAEVQLIKTREDAINLSKAKENFLSVMSHEMRTPLNAVIGMARILKDEDPLDRQRDNLNILDFSAQNLLTLINDVLDFTKIETGNLQLESQPIDIRSLVSKTIESLKFKTQENSVKVIYEIDNRIPQLILGDSTRLYQIFMNLLGNAVKFTKEGEIKLSISLEKDNIDNLDIKFEISDTGIGIPKDKLVSIFDAYTQAETDTSRKYGGTGLGLAITKKLVALHQSTIYVESKLGEGTTFYFSLSLPKAESNDKSILDEIESPLHAKILVVDDNTINRLLAKKILKKWSVETDFAENGLEAVNKVKENNYDLVLMDIHMPIMGGMEAALTIRQDERYQSLPIIALTGSVLSPNSENFSKSGMDDFVLKPFEPSILYKKIKQHLAKATVN